MRQLPNSCRCGRAPVLSRIVREISRLPRRCRCREDARTKDLVDLPGRRRVFLFHPPVQYGAFRRGLKRVMNDAMTPGADPDPASMLAFPDRQFDFSTPQAKLTVVKSGAGVTGSCTSFSRRHQPQNVRKGDSGGKVPNRRDLPLVPGTKERVRSWRSRSGTS